ncbi:MAG: TIGR04283 family arsenosugar biosynthesis glycosyltransferase [Smithellaceae bacterium]|jgi:rSAM/selenodomain-associated transferase 2
MMQLIYSFIIPVYREEEIINSTIDHLMHLQKFAAAEIIVADGDYEGSTLREISKANVKKILCPKGRARQMNCGAAKSSGDILIFLHADTRLPEKALKMIATLLEDETIVGGAFDLGIDSQRFAFRIIEKIASLRSRLTRIPYGDQAIFIRRDYFQSLGGFKDIPIMEDVELMRRIKRRRGKINILKDKVKTSPRRWETEGVVFCTLRNWFLITLYSLGAKPESLAKFYR